MGFDITKYLTCPARTCRSEGGVEMILDAAAEEFAEKGYEGARVDAIARAAGVNKATLYYQIGGKQALYDAVTETVMGGFAEALKGVAGEAGTPEEKVRAYVHIFAHFNGRIRLVAPVALREIASGGRHLSDTALAHMASSLALLSQLIKAGEADGSFRPANAMMVHMMIVGSLFFYAANCPIRERIAANADLAEAVPFPTMEEAAEHVADLVLSALKRGDF